MLKTFSFVSDHRIPRCIVFCDRGMGLPSSSRENEVFETDLYCETAKAKGKVGYQLYLFEPPVILNY